MAGRIEIANFVEASRAVIKGPYDVSLVEGSITTPHDAERIHAIRRASKFLVTIGACATAGGIQALRNFKDVKEFLSVVYARPDYIQTLSKSTPIADHVRVDFELRGCPINKNQLVELIGAFLSGRKPNTPHHSVCVECKLRGNVCVMVAHGTPCLGPVTHAGCGAICPAYHRGCYGCFGPKETPNRRGAQSVIVIDAMQSGVAPGTIRRFDAHPAPLPACLVRRSTHAFGIADGIELGRALGSLPPRLLVYGIEIQDAQMGASVCTKVEAAVEQLAQQLLAELTAPVAFASVHSPPPARGLK